MAPNPASSRQLSYLRRLADQTGQTFTYPQTSREALAEEPASMMGKELSAGAS